VISGRGNSRTWYSDGFVCEFIPMENMVGGLRAWNIAFRDKAADGM
jgi:hypothetical protein